MKKSYKIYGVNGHRQKVSFISSTNFIDNHGVKIELMTADKTNTHDFVIMNIEASTEKQIDTAFLGQISDGILKMRVLAELKKYKKCGGIKMYTDFYDFEGMSADEIGEFLFDNCREMFNGKYFTVDGKRLYPVYENGIIESWEFD